MQILLNLLTNASKFSGQHATLTMKTYAAGGAAVFPKHSVKQQVGARGTRPRLATIESTAAKNKKRASATRPYHPYFRARSRPLSS